MRWGFSSQRRMDRAKRYLSTASRGDAPDGFATGRGRDEDCSLPPAQIRTCSLPAYGSHLGSKRSIATAVVRMLPAPVSHCFWLCVQSVLCWPAFPLASALRSTDSAANRSALFAGFPATTASSDFPRPYIIGYSFSPSRCGPWGHLAIGQTRDLPVSDAILPRVMCSSTPAGWTAPRVAVLSMLRSTVEKVSAPSDKDISWLNHTPHAAVVYASWPSLPPAHATLTSRRLATPYLRWTSTSQSRQPPGAFLNSSY